jgi:hypothetical protein
VSRDSHNCPHCGVPCGRDEVHNGVAMIHGPWGCGSCGWSERPEYDCRGGVRMDGDERVFDPCGGSHHVDRLGTDRLGTVLAHVTRRTS